MAPKTRRALALLAALHHIRSRRTRRYWVHPMLQRRNADGEDLKIEAMYNDYPDKFFQYTRMTPDIFDKLLQMVTNKLSGIKTNFRNPIPARTRLFVILR